jgi:predicted nucleic acid-binding protein
MPYLIDSDWVIDHLDDRPTARALLERLAPEGIAISIVTYLEAYQGVERHPDRPAAEERFQAFVDSVPLLYVTIAVARRCARLRETLRRQNRRVNGRALDLLNAAIALEHSLILVTRNMADYRDIPDLQLYQEAGGAGT